MKKLLPYALSFCCGIPFFTPAQPIRTTLLPSPGSIRITNDSIKSYANITLEWQIWANGTLRQKGAIPGLVLPPGHPKTLHLSLHPLSSNEEALLKVDYRGLTRSKPPLASQYLRVKPWEGDIAIPAAGDLNFTDSNDLFTVTSPTLQAAFDKETGWIRQFEADHFLVAADTGSLRPQLPTLPHLQLFSTSTGSQMVIVRAEYTLPELSCLLHMGYTVNAAGNLLVEQTLETDTSHPDSIVHHLVRFGIDWMPPAGLDSVAWYGLTADNQDTIPSVHYWHLHQVVPPPPARMVRWLTLTDAGGKGLRLTADSNYIYRITATPAADSVRQDPARLQWHIDALLPSADSPGIHCHQAFKLTPIALAPVPARSSAPSPTRSTPSAASPARSSSPSPAKKPGN